MSLRQVSRIVDQLEKGGELGVNRSGGRTSHTYSLALMNPDKLSTLNQPNVDKMSMLNSDKMSRLGAPNDDNLSGLKGSNVDISSSNMDIAMSTDQSLDQSTLISNKNRSDQIDPPFGGSEFRTALLNFEQHRKEKKSKLTPTARKQMYKKFGQWGEARATAALIYSTEQGYTGCFEQNRNGNNNATTGKRSEPGTGKGKEGYGGIRPQRVIGSA